MKYLLSGIARCGACQAALWSTGTGGRAPGDQGSYRCHRIGCGKVYRSVRQLDRYVTAAVVARLADPQLRLARIPADPGVAAEMLALQRRREEAERVIESYAERPERLDLLARALDSIDGRLGQLRERVQGSAAGRLLGEHAGITPERFGELPLATRRALVQASVSVVVLPGARRHPRGAFDTEAIQISRVPLSGDAPV
jgi:hypothetical protein